MLSQTDSNNPSFWRDGTFHLINSVGAAQTGYSGPDQFHLGSPSPIYVSRGDTWPVWIESVWVDPDGPIFGWYHQERFGLCPGTNLSVPRIGAVISYDGGASFYDMGIVLSSGEAIDCRSQNGYFAGGHGDFTVIPDRQREFFYIFFTNYGGPVETQGVVAARMPFTSRWSPLGAVRKYFQGEWAEPGLGGRTTPVFPAKVSWQRPDTNSFWGPSLHWNTFLDSFVMLINRSCCTPGFPQKAIWTSFNADLSKPESWTKPSKILEDIGWYPQVIGLGSGVPIRVRDVSPASTSTDIRAGRSSSKSPSPPLLRPNSNGHSRPFPVSAP